MGVVFIHFLGFVVVHFFCRPIEEQIVRLKIHHGGMFIYKPFTMYINDQIVEEEWGWDVDTMSYIDFTKVINSLGYKSFKCLWYRDPRKALSRWLKLVNCDFDILQLAKDVFGFNVVGVYVDQRVFDKSSKKLNDVKGDEVLVIHGVEAKALVEGEDKAKGQVEEMVESEDEAEGQVEAMVESEDEVEGQVEDEVQVEVIGNVP